MSVNSINFIPGKIISHAKRDFLGRVVGELRGKPRLLIIQVGDDVASTIYVNKKIEYAADIGIEAESKIFLEDTTTSAIVSEIAKLSSTDLYDGVMVQSPPLGRSRRAQTEIFNAIPAELDVDGLSRDSLGALWQLRDYQAENDADWLEQSFAAATPLGCLDALLWSYYFATFRQQGKDSQELANWIAMQGLVSKLDNLKTKVKGKRILVINHSNIVGKPLGALLLGLEASVSFAHAATNDIRSLIKQNDVIITATGKDGIWHLHDDFVENQIILDVGITSSSPNESPIGDINPGQLVHREDASTFYAPVPGGVGPLTVANLLHNVVLSYINRNDLTMPDYN